MNTLLVYLVSISFLTLASLLLIRSAVRQDYLLLGHLKVWTASLQALIFFIYGGFPIIYLPQYWPESGGNDIVRYSGCGILAIGLSIILINMFRLGIRQSLGLKTNRLKDTEFYKISRNPQVLGCWIYIAGFVILWPSWYAVGWGISLAVVTHSVIRTEEEHLRRLFGEEYELYCKLVPRYFKFLGWRGTGPDGNITRNQEEE